MDSKKELVLWLWRGWGVWNFVSWLWSSSGTTAALIIFVDKFQSAPLVWQIILTVGIFSLWLGIVRDWVTRKPINKETTNSLNIKVNELVINKVGEVRVTFIITSKSSRIIKPTEFMGSVKLDASTVSNDLKLTNLISSYCFKQYDTEILIRFTTQPEIISKLKNKILQRQEAYWTFDLDWRIIFPSGLQSPWKTNGIRFEQIPRIGNV